VITTFQAKNYGCLVDVTAQLTPIHAFIGPNDSGKSTLLHGMRTLVQLAGEAFELSAEGQWQPFEPFLRDPLSGMNGPPRSGPEQRLACVVEGAAYVFKVGSADWNEAFGAISVDGPYVATALRPFDRPSWVLRSAVPESPEHEAVIRQLAAARLVRFDPDALRAPSGLIPETSSVGFLDDRGRGLGGVYFAIRNRNDDAFATIVKDVRKHFPTVKGLRVKAVTSGEVALEAELTSGVHVGANRMSEGLLYYLAFAALRHIDPVSLLLVEEPENGLHPARIAEVVRVLRAIVEDTGTQVILATHSPLVVNELRPEEVSVVTRDPVTGTKVTRIHETPDFAERAKIYALGELWIAYANGDDERPLLSGTEP